MGVTAEKAVTIGGTALSARVEISHLSEQVEGVGRIEEVAGGNVALDAVGDSASVPGRG